MRPRPQAANISFTSFHGRKAHSSRTEARARRARPAAPGACHGTTASSHVGRVRQQPQPCAQPQPRPAHLSSARCRSSASFSRRFCSSRCCSSSCSFCLSSCRFLMEASLRCLVESKETFRRKHRQGRARRNTRRSHLRPARGTPPPRRAGAAGPGSRPGPGAVKPRLDQGGGTCLRQNGPSLLTEEEKAAPPPTERAQDPPACTHGVPAV